MARPAAAQRRRTLFLTTSYPRFAGDAGGHFVEAAAQERIGAGDEVIVMAPGAGPYVEMRDRVRIVWLGGKGAFGWPGLRARLTANPAAARDLLRVAVRAGEAVSTLSAPPDEVHAHWLLPCAWPLAARVRASCVGYAHGADVRLLRSLPAALRAALVDRLLGTVRSFRFAAAALRDDLLQALDERRATRVADRSEVVLPSFSLPSLPSRSTMRATLGLRDDDSVAVTLGRLLPGKRVHLAVAAAARSQHHLLIVGDGPERARLAQLADALAARVTFVPTVPRPHALGILAAADVLLHPAEVDAAPTVVREARALGVPVVSCGAGDVPRWAERDPGIRCVAPLAPALADALGR